MPVLHKVVVTIPHVSGLAEDAVVNGFYFRDDSGIFPITDYDNVRDMLKDFYTVVAPDASQKVCQYFQENYGGNVAVRMYNTEDPEPRYPVYESGFTMPRATGTTPMPSEVAAVMSFGRLPDAGTPAARRRNRVYLGPLNTTVMNPSNGLFDVDFVDNVVLAGQELWLASQASSNWTWVGFSGADNESFDLQWVAMDDAADTQRRRGVSRTVKRVSFEGTPTWTP